MPRISAVTGGLFVILTLGWALLVTLDRGRAEQRPLKPSGDAGLTLDELVSGKLSIVDLTWTLDDGNPYWPAENYEPFHLKTIATIEKNGVLSKAFYTPEHLGTHLDAPNHFEQGQRSVDEIDPGELFAPGVVIDVSPQAETDADYRFSVDDISAWEREHGLIPERAIVFLHTGWGRHWKNYPRYKNQDATGKMHFPGYSEAAARFLVTERNVRGIGIDTLSIDYGLSKDFIVHHVVNAAGRYGLENVSNLDQLPRRDFYVFVAPVKIKTGSGGPTRIMAVFRPPEKID
jgi:kynurenine formamidase